MVTSLHQDVYSTRSGVLDIGLPPEQALKRRAMIARKKKMRDGRSFILKFLIDIVDG
jgi:hypothetical protein